MGAWGTGIFADDMACDIRGDYFEMLQYGKTDSEAEEAILNQYKEYIGEEDEPTFWFAFAYSQWKKGRLSEYVKQKALYFLDNGGDLERWEDEKRRANRQKVLEELKETLDSEMPKRTKLRKPKTSRSPWKPGDLLALKIHGSNTKTADLVNKYALLRVLGLGKNRVSKYAEADEYDESVFLGIYGWYGNEIPEYATVKSLHFLSFPLNNPGRPGPIYDGIELNLYSEDMKEAKAILVIGNDEGYDDALRSIFLDKKFESLHIGCIRGTVARAIQLNLFGSII